MCPVLLPPGGYPIAVNKYTIYFLTIKYFGLSCCVVRSVLTVVSKDPNAFTLRATHSDQSGNA